MHRDESRGARTASFAPLPTCRVLEEPEFLQRLQSKWPAGTLRNYVDGIELHQFTKLALGMVTRAPHYDLRDLSELHLYTDGSADNNDALAAAGWAVSVIGKSWAGHYVFLGAFAGRPRGGWGRFARLHVVEACGEVALELLDRGRDLLIGQLRIDPSRGASRRFCAALRAASA